MKRRGIGSERHPPKKEIMRSLAAAAVTLALLVVALPAAKQAPAFASPLALQSSDPQLVAAFEWAKAQATAYAFEGDDVGPWFEAALPGREAFCMRDVAHQAMGAHALGLQAHVRNMLRRFAEQVSDERDWCSLWEIDRHGRPAHADYRNDQDFWYNLPANFDVLDAAWRMYLWSGDPSYLHDPALDHFYRRTVTDYVRRWALSPEAVMTRPRILNRAASPDADARFKDARGIPGYNEDTDDFVAGLDLLAAEYAGFAAYARILETRGDAAGARTWLRRAADVRALVNSTWWDEKAQGFYDHLTTGYRLGHRGPSAWNSAALYWPVAADGVHLRKALDSLVMQIAQSRSAPIEEQSHHPEILYRYGAADVAYDQVLDLSRPTRARREYPEVSFSVVGALVTGLMGVSVDPVPPGRDTELLDYFANQSIFTLPRLTAATEWAELRHLPVRANDVTVRHDGTMSTTLTNNRGPALVWRAALPGRFDELMVDGRPVKPSRLVLPPGLDVSVVRLVVAPGTRAKVEAPVPRPTSPRR
jgi:hypothetical protein